MEFKDLTGDKYGRLTVLKRVENIGRRTQWLCKCECGQEAKVTSNNLRRGNTKSCGCLKDDHSGNYKHNLCYTRIYRCWQSMRERCMNPNFERYAEWGGRGITVCDEWKDDFMSFYYWSLENGYQEDLTIDRINNDGNYEPSNCRWSTRRKQNCNKRNNHLITYKGRTMCIAEWAIETDIPRTVINDRVNKLCWSVDKALTTEIKGGNYSGTCNI